MRPPRLIDVLLSELDDDALEQLAERLAPSLAHLARADHDPSPWLNTEEAARYLACSCDRLYDLVQTRKLTPARDGRRLLFRRPDLDAYLEAGA